MPYPWSANDILTASDLNAAFGSATGAWTTYTPALVQSGAVTKTVTVARYIKIGRTVHAEVLLAVTGAGTATNAILIGLPVAAASAGDLPVGVGMVVDASAGGVYTGVALLNTTTAVYLLANSVTTGAIIGAAAPMSAALASGDSVRICVTYDAAS